MKKVLFLFALLSLTIATMSQDIDKTFDKIILAKGGIQYADGTIQSTATSGGGVVYWNAITGKPTFATVATSGSYADLLNRPTLFDGTYASLTGKPTTFAPSAHNHATLYKPLAYVPTWSEITSKPDTVSFENALSTVSSFVPPSYTTAQINAMTNVKPGSFVYDKTLNVMKYWNGTMWKIFVTGN